MRPGPPLTIALLSIALTTTAACGGRSQGDTIRVQGTTDTVDAGLVDGYDGSPGIKTLFARWETAHDLPADTLAYTGVGTGAALNNARGGQADVVITHAPSLEARFVAQGYSAEPLGRAIFSSDYVIVGPRADPAGVLAAAPHDAAGAFERIAAAGARGDAVFASRGDNSGTNVQEQVIWGLTDEVATQKATNGDGDATRLQPVGGDGAGTRPAWYVTTSKGQAANVQQCATTAGCYTMTDRGTFHRLLKSGTLTALKIVAERNAPAARGGANLLVSPFSAYVVNPSASFPGGSPTPNVAAARRFVDFLTSEFFQDAVDAFPRAGDPAFRGDAFPTVRGTPPRTVAAGTRIELDLTLTDKLPGGGAVAGMPVTLQASVDGGKTFADVEGPTPTTAAGRVMFRPLVGATTTYRVSLPRYTKFSPNVQTLGLVAVAATRGRPVDAAR